MVREEEPWNRHAERQRVRRDDGARLTGSTSRRKTWSASDCSHTALLSCQHPRCTIQTSAPLIVTFFWFFVAFVWAQSKWGRVKWKHLRGEKHNNNENTCLFGLYCSKMYIPGAWVIYAHPPHMLLDCCWNRDGSSFLFLTRMSWWIFIYQEFRLSSSKWFFSVCMHTYFCTSGYWRITFLQMYSLLCKLAQLQFPFVFSSPDLINGNYLQAFVIEIKKEV